MRARSLFSLASVLVATNCFAVRYKVYDLGVLPPTSGSWAWGLNESRTVAGGGNRPFTWTEAGGLMLAGPRIFSSQSSTFHCINDLGEAAGNTAWLVAGRLIQTQPCVWSPASGYTLIPLLPGEGQGWAYGLNDSGTVVGRMIGQREEAFVWDRALGTRAMGHFDPRFGSTATDISDAGEACGTAGVPPDPGFTRAFRWTANTGLVNLGVLPGYTSSWGMAINSLGEVVGWCDKANTSTAFRAKRGEQMVDAMPGFQGIVYPLDLNDQGWFCGTGFGTQGQFAGVCTSDGTVIDVAANAEGGTGGLFLYQATSINEHGDVCGNSLTPSNQNRAFFAKRLD